MISILLGIVSSTVAEIITAVNKKLAGTFLQGTAAFLVAFGVSIIGGIVKIVLTPGFSVSSLTNLTTLVNDCSQVFAVSQIYFLLVTEKLGLDVQAPTQEIKSVTVSTSAPSAV